MNINIQRQGNAPATVTVMLADGSDHTFSFAPDVSDERINFLVPILITREVQGGESRRRRRRSR